MLRFDNAGLVESGRERLAPLSLDWPAGKVHAILGPNGAGKSTLLKLASGEYRTTQGVIEWHGRPIGQWSAQALARLRAVLPQTHALSFPLTAAEVVALGRLSARDRRRDHRIVDDALAACGAADLADRPYPRLSGGERARVQLARVLAQIWEPQDHPRYLLLDEPTAHLDLAYQHACLQQARQWAARNIGVLIVLHDPNLALAYADTATLIAHGRLVAHGPTREVLDPQHIASVYGLHATRIDAPGLPPWLVIEPPHNSTAPCP